MASKPGQPKQTAPKPPGAPPAAAAAPAGKSPSKPPPGPRQPFAARMAEAANKNLKLTPCKICNRKFQEARLAEHEAICSHIQKKPRKKFDSRQQRLSGTVAEQFVGSIGKGQKPKHPPNNWRAKNDEMMQLLRSGREAAQHLAAGGKAADLPPPPASDYSDYVQCPYCGRRFNNDAAQRHIPSCKDMVHNKAGGGSGVGGAGFAGKSPLLAATTAVVKLANLKAKER